MGFFRGTITRVWAMKSEPPRPTSPSEMPDGSAEAQTRRIDAGGTGSSEELTVRKESSEDTTAQAAGTKAHSLPPNSRLPRELPADFGRYLLLKLLGQGGMGTSFTLLTITSSTGR